VYGGAIVGSSDQAVAVFVHRPIINPFDQVRIPLTDANPVAAAGLGVLNGSPTGAAIAQEAGQVADVLYGNKTWGAAFALHAWTDTSTQFGAGDPAVPNTTIDALANFGYHVTDGTDAHVGADVLSINQIGTGFGLNAGFRRIAAPANARLVLGGEAEFRIFSPKGTGAKSVFALAVPFKAGALIDAGHDIQLSVLGGVDAQIIDEGMPATDTFIGLGAPILEMGAEWSAASWLQIRTGLKGGFGFQVAGGPTGNPKPMREQLAFATGVGIHGGPFHLDATLAYSFWQNGPFILGGVPGLFSGVSLGYDWEGSPTAPPSTTPENNASSAAPPAPPPPPPPAPPNP
jgi:hypothetical protein